MEKYLTVDTAFAYWFVAGLVTVFVGALYRKRGKTMRDPAFWGAVVVCSVLWPMFAVVMLHVWYKYRKRDKQITSIPLI
jgi:hypothetical protein